MLKTTIKYIASAKDKYNKLLNNFLANEQLNSLIQNYKQMKNNQEWVEILNWQNLVLNILYENGGSLWYDTKINKYAFRSKIGGTIVYENRENISELLTRALKDKITACLNRDNVGFHFDYVIEIILVQKIHSVQNLKLKANEKAPNVIKILIFENAILTIDDDTFDIESANEFKKHVNNFFYTRNRFVPTKYLKKRFSNNYLSRNYPRDIDRYFTFNETSYLLENAEQIENYSRSSFIEDFIFYLVGEDMHLFYYTMNWLSYFFNSLHKSGTALVFLGDQEVTEGILWEKIIIEIFGLQHCLLLNNKECTTTSLFEIAKDKLFFHISDITNAGTTKFDDKTLYEIVKDLLIKQSVVNDEQEEVNIHGQIIITAKNPYPYIKRAFSKCTIINVSGFDTLIEKLKVPDETILEEKIEKDLENFTDILRSFNGNYELAKYALNTKDRERLSNEKSSNIVKEDIEKSIDAFIQAILDRDIGYFEKVRGIDEDGAIYEHLKNAFEKDKPCFIGQDLLEYYNATHEQKFEKKKDLMDKLREKHEMFSQEVKTLRILTADKKEEILFQAPSSNKDTGNKELYKIKGYTMAKDITIPYGAIITTSQDSILKYNHPDKENAIKINKEYREKKGKEKS